MTSNLNFDDFYQWGAEFLSQQPEAINPIADASQIPNMVMSPGILIGKLRPYMFKGQKGLIGTMGPHLTVKIVEKGENYYLFIHGKSFEQKKIMEKLDKNIVKGVVPE